MECMELELGLALKTHDPMQRLDLNKSWFEPNDMGASDGLRQGDPIQVSLGGSGQVMFPLVSWNEEPNKEDDNGSIRGNSSCHLKNVEDDKYVKGWPPIQSWRKKFLPMYYNGSRAYRGSNSMFIKVKMEGVAIARKINLRCYDSYEALFDNLITMFAKYTENGDENTNMSNYYTLRFQDGEGNWLQAKDSPWESLVDCVQRIVIRRNIAE